MTQQLDPTFRHRLGRHAQDRESRLVDGTIGALNGAREMDGFVRAEAVALEHRVRGAGVIGGKGDKVQPDAALERRDELAGKRGIVGSGEKLQVALAQHRAAVGRARRHETVGTPVTLTRGRGQRESGRSQRERSGVQIRNEVSDVVEEHFSSARNLAYAHDASTAWSGDGFRPIAPSPLPRGRTDRVVSKPDDVLGHSTSTPRAEAACVLRTEERLAKLHRPHTSIRRCGAVDRRPLPSVRSSATVEPR